MNNARAVRATTSDIVWRLPLVAVMSRRTFRQRHMGVRSGALGGVSGIAQVHELDAFHDAAVVPHRDRR